MSFKYDDGGLQKELSKIGSAANQINGSYQLGDVFTDDFMKKHTNHGSIDNFFNESPFKIETEEDFDNIDEHDLDKYVRSVSSFNSWDELKGTAGEIYIAKKLGLN